MNPLRKKLLYISILCAFFLASCVPGVVINPKAYDVKTVALASVSANRIPHKLEVSAFATEEEGDYFESLSINKAKEKKSRRFVRSMTNYASTVFEKKFKGVQSWKIMPRRKVFSSRAYRRFAAKMGKYSRNLLKERKLNRRLFKYNFRTANLSKRKRMAFVPENGLTEAEKNMLAQLARDLKVDAVAVMDIDLAYTAEEAPGTFSAFAGVSVVLVSSDGEYAILTSSVKGGEDTAFRLKSDETVSLPRGEIVFKKKVFSIFKDSIQGGIGEIAAKIQEGLTSQY